jgi:hypothetical protein
MKKHLLLLLLVSSSSCSKKEENRLPRLIIPKANKVIEVNSKEMLQNQSPC